MKGLGKLAKTTQDQDFYPGGLVLEFTFLLTSLYSSVMGHPYKAGLFFCFFVFWNILILLFDPLSKLW